MLTYTEKIERLKFHLRNYSLGTVNDCIQQDFGGNVNNIICQTRGMPLLHYVACECSISVLEWFIIKFKPDMNILDPVYGRSVHTYSNHSPQTLRVLLEHDTKANLNKIIRVYALWENSPCVELLLDYGATIWSAQFGISDYCTYRIGNSAGITAVKRVIGDYEHRALRCKDASLYLLAMKKRHVLHRDILTALAKRVWVTRRMKEWK